MPIIALDWAKLLWVQVVSVVNEMGDETRLTGSRWALL